MKLSTRFDDATDEITVELKTPHQTFVRKKRIKDGFLYSNIAQQVGDLWYSLAKCATNRQFEVEVRDSKGPLLRVDVLATSHRTAALLAAELWP